MYNIRVEIKRGDAKQDADIAQFDSVSEAVLRLGEDRVLKQINYAENLRQRALVYQRIKKDRSPGEQT
jgi:hypothetical protein